MRCNLVVYSLVILLVACKTKVPDRITIYAASSLSNVLLAWDSMYCKPRGLNVAFNFGSSGTLVRQIMRDAPCDILIPASAEHIFYLKSKNMIDDRSVKSLASNNLVLIAPNTSAESVLSMPRVLPDKARVALGDTTHVPAGVYAVKALKHAGLMESWRPHLIPTSNVRMALYLAEAGEVDYAFVFKSDGLESKNCTIVCEFDESVTGSIQYLGAAMKHSPYGRAFLQQMDESVLLDSLFVVKGFIMEP